MPRARGATRGHRSALRIAGSGRALVCPPDFKSGLGADQVPGWVRFPCAPAMRARLGRTSDPMSHESAMTARSSDAYLIHLQLGALSGLLWLIAAFHLLVLDRRETW